MCPHGARTVSTSLLQQMVHKKALSTRFNFLSSLSLSALASARAAREAIASSDERDARISIAGQILCQTHNHSQDLYLHTPIYIVYEVFCEDKAISEIVEADRVTPP